jgi:hypothetical protein
MMASFDQVADIPQRDDMFDRAPNPAKLPPRPNTFTPIIEDFNDDVKL